MFPRFQAAARRGRRSTPSSTTSSMLIRRHTLEHSNFPFRLDAFTITFAGSISGFETMTNPNQAMRMLIIYAIVIPLAVVMGFLLTNPLDYTTLGFIAIILALIVAPVFIKWHYPIMVFGLTFPATMFFLKGSPPFWQIVVLISLGIAIVERTMNRDKRFLRAPAMTWALLFTVVAVCITMKLTGGFGLHAIGGKVGGGKKYINIFLGVAAFFALASQGIPPQKQKLYVALFFLPGIFAVVGDLFPVLPGPLRYFNLIFPPSGYVLKEMYSSSLMFRLVGLSTAAGAAMLFMLARYGVRGMLPSKHLFRFLMFVLVFIVSLMGGFRSALIGSLLLLAIIFWLEGLHRTRWMLFVLVGMFIGSTILIPMTRQLPYNLQRSLSFLPLNVDPVARADAQASTEWRLTIWRAILPKVPEYLLLGKGYALTAQDYESLGADNPFAASAKVDASLEGLAISNDFHSGPLSTIICMGIWGCISILAIMGAGLFVLYRNIRYGDPGLRTVNTLLLALYLKNMLIFFFIYGAYDADIFHFTYVVGFSVALNWGVCRRKAEVAASPAIQRVPRPATVRLSQPGLSATGRV